MRSSRFAPVVVAALVAIMVATMGSASASAAPIADKLRAAEVLIVMLSPDGTATIGLASDWSASPRTGAKIYYPGKCAVSIVDRTDGRVLFHGKVARGIHTVSIESPSLANGLIDIDGRASCAKRSVTVKKDAKPYRVVFTSVTASFTGLTRFGDLGNALFN